MKETLQVNFISSTVRPEMVISLFFFSCVVSMHNRAYRLREKKKQRLVFLFTHRIWSRPRFIYFLPTAIKVRGMVVVRIRVRVNVKVKDRAMGQVKVTIRVRE